MPLSPRSDPRDGDKLVGDDGLADCIREPAGALGFGQPVNGAGEIGAGPAGTQILLAAPAAEALALTGGERGLLASEIDKLALYLDASPEAPRAATPEALDALGAEGGEQQLFKAAAIILSGNVAGAEREIAWLRRTGG